ncbi:CGNR zinc finger domain-containing protein [Dermatobacter hominis]|uniref:CGNR zinc finger domain-containing protein n=1 Tax=Dermatobacter hominis TaxID=2884263 RepID=UPI001D12E937|nr:ABATE domain-containing protein [Dermatobacter hominis]UDY36619.1 ABATE domain-containing protein [Dermatobacter hominis]
MHGDATGRVLTDPRTGVSFPFDAGAHCLDFAHSGGEGPYAVFESLHRPEDLADWLARPPLGAGLTEPPTARDLVEAKRLRQAIWTAAHAAADRRPLDPADVDTINRAAAWPTPVPELVDGGAASAWAAPVRARQVLSLLAREAVALLSGPSAGRIRECASDDCPLVFVDTSRPGARRWCAMERCGNRHKQRARRARRADP